MKWYLVAGLLLAVLIYTLIIRAIHAVVRTCSVCRGEGCRWCDYTGDAN